MLNLRRRSLRSPFAALVITGAVCCSGAIAADAPAPASTAPAPAAAPAKKKSPYNPVSVSNRAREHYIAVWGVDDLAVQETASGNLIRFSYKVVNPQLAKPLVTKGETPYLIGQRNRAVLQVPTMEKVGQLRQSTSDAKIGQEYWMDFSNKGNLVKKGDRVNIKVGRFHVDGLLVM